MILGIDIGTTSLSIASVADDGTFIEARTFPGVPLDEDRCQDVNAVWNNVQSAIKAFPTPDKIAVTGQMHGILFLDKSGNAVSPLYTWQNPYGDRPYEDTTYADYMTRMTGYPCASGYGSVTAFYLMKNHRIPAEADSICTIGDYVAMRLAGAKRPVMHCSNAASLGLYDLNRLCFDTDAITALEIPAGLYPETKNTVCEIANGVYNAIGDNQASFAGSVDSPETSLLINIGTGGQLSCLSDTVQNLPNLETRPYNAGKYLLNASSLCGGRAYAMLKHFFSETLSAFGVDDSKLDIYAVMEQLARENESKHAQLLVDTAFSGTRAEPSRRGSITGISEDNFTPSALIDGFLHGIAAEFLPAYESLKAVRSFDSLALSGNAVRRNAYLRQIFKKLYGLPLAPAAPPEEAACGAAKLVSIQ